MSNQADDRLEDVEIAEGQNGALSEATASRSPARGRRHWLTAMAIFVVLVVIIVPTAVVTSRNKNKDSESESVSSESVVVENSTNVSPPPPTTQFNETNTTSPPTSTSGLPGFGIDVVRGYASPDELQTDIQFAGEFVMTQVVKRNLQYSGYEGVGYGRGNPNAFQRDANTISAPEMDAMPEKSTTTGGGSDVAQDLTDYGTNNQEDNVEEGDMVVSDGNLLYTAYGDYVVVVNPRTGVEVVRFQMPPIKDSSDGDSNFFPGGPAVDIMPYFMPQPAVRSLVMNEANKRLLVIADGYSTKSIQERVIPESDGNATSLPIIFEYLGTHIRIYDTDALASGDTEPLFTKNVHGSFSGVRVIDTVAHLMTISGVDVYTDLIEPFERYNYPNLSDEKYLRRVQRKSEAATAQFTDKLMDDLTVQDGSIPNLARISLYTDASNSMAELTLPNGPMNTYAQIASFDLGGDTFPLSLSGTFLPDYWAQFYAATNALVITGQGSRFLGDVTNQEMMPTSIDTTYFLTFSVDGTNVAPHSVGKVDGFIVNTYAIDVVGDILRVAVTIRENTWWGFVPIVEPIDLPTVVDDGAVEPKPVDDGDSSTSNTGGGRLRGLQDNEIVVGEPNPATRVPGGGGGGGGGGGEDESLTENYLITLQMPGSDGESAGEMVELGRVKLGKPNETITTVRYIDNKAFAVTFEQTDPFYTIDLSNPAAPTVVGELEISGFSSYLHPINADNSLILAIGQEANENGTVVGMQITIFDVSDLSDPQVLHRLVIEDSKTTESWSEALWDFKATRYAGGRLIIPIDIYNWYNNGTDDLHGYIVFKADETGIEEECRINHGNEPMYVDMCFYCASLPRRSMIFDGDLVTFNTHFIASTDMQTCSSNWETAVAISGDDTGGMGCCGRW